MKSPSSQMFEHDPGRAARLRAQDLQRLAAVRPPPPPRARPLYRIKGARVGPALALGAMTGGASLALAGVVLAVVGVMGPDRQADFVGWQGLGRLFSWFVLGSLIYGLGLAVVTPLWLALHLARARQWWVALILGAGLSVAAARPGAAHIPPLHPGSTQNGLGVQIGVLMVMAAIGALVGLVIWRVAYRRSQT